MNVIQIVAPIQHLFPANVAIRFEGQSVTYRELDELSQRIARVLTELGISRGDRVALYLPNNPEYIVTYLGILRLGAIAVSINPALKSAEVQFILQDSGAQIVVTTAALSERVSVLKPTSLKVITETQLTELMAQDTPGVAVTEMRTDEAAVILYTSGTTGFPKGAVLSHGNLIAAAQQTATTFQLESDNRLLLCLPLCHSFGQTTVLLPCLSVGATLILEREFELEKTLRTINAHQVSHFFGVPTLYQMLEQATPMQLQSIQHYYSGAAPLPQELSQRWQEKFGMIIQEKYGSTETSLLCFNPALKHQTGGAVGLPLPGIEIKLVHDGGEEVSTGEVGEVVVRGPNVMQGYWQRPQETALVLKDGWLHTGDLGRRDADGYLYLTDRQKDLINVGGEKVYPSEVERVLSQHPSIAAVAVYGVPESLLGEQVRASIVLKPGAQVTTQEITAYCYERLADFKVPTGLEWVAALPTGKTGKILKKVLREQFLASAATLSAIRPSEFITAETLKTWLTDWLMRELAIDAEMIESDSSLLHYGMNSINAVILAQELSIFLGKEVPPTSALKYPTVEQLTVFLLSTLSKTADITHQTPSQSIPDEAWYPQLYNQQECYLWHEQVANPACLHICLPMRIGSPVNETALQAALQSLVDRHEVLRTVYSRQGTQLMQRVLTSQTVVFETMKIVSPSWEAVAPLIQETARRPFNLEQGPLLRGHLFHRELNDYLFLIVTHHIVVDATAFAILFNELLSLYQTYQRGLTMTLPAVERTFLDYVRWQTATLQSPEGEWLWHYWQQQLAGDVPRLNLPTDYPRPLVASHYGASYFFQLDAPLTLKLRTLARKEGGTLYMLLLAALQWLLHQYTKQNDILVAAHTLNRTKPEFATLVGYLADTVAIRTRISDQATFRETFQQVRTTVLTSLEHQGYPMKLLEKRLQLSRDSLCNVWFTMLPQQLFQEMGALLTSREKESVELGGLTLESINDIIPSWLGVWYELEMNLMEGPEVVSGTLTYSTDLFKEATIMQMANDFQHLLNTIVTTTYD